MTRTFLHLDRCCWCSSGTGGSGTGGSGTGGSGTGGVTWLFVASNIYCLVFGVNLLQEPLEISRTIVKIGMGVSKPIGFVHIGSNFTCVNENHLGFLLVLVDFATIPDINTKVTCPSDFGLDSNVGFLVVDDVNDLVIDVNILPFCRKVGTWLIKGSVYLGDIPRSTEFEGQVLASEEGEKGQLDREVKEVLVVLGEPFEIF